jgi:adenylate cyclase
LKKHLKIIHITVLTAFVLFFIARSLARPDSFLANKTNFLFSLEGFVTDIKFKIRGEKKLKNDIVLVEIDNKTLSDFSEYGRWPWQRDPQAFLLYSILQFDPKLVVLDIIYSENESVRIPKELEEDLLKIGQKELVQKYSPEAKLLKVINKYKDKIVLTSGADSLEIEQNSDVPHITNAILNRPEYLEVSKYVGFSVSQPNSDGILRDTYLKYHFEGKFQPSLALVAAQVANESFVAPSETLSQINFATDVSPFHSISAADVLMAQQDSEEAKLIRELLAEKIKNKIVVFGVTATSVGDVHATPIGLLSGPEIVVSTIDNLMENDFFKRASVLSLVILVFCIFLLLCLSEFFKNKMSSRLTLLVGFGFLFLVIVIDALAFSANINLNSGWLYLLVLSNSFFVIYEKYSLEESKKEFIKNAFSKYISPAYVDEIIKNPDKLKLGGQKKELTVLFSDIRGFTNFSENMDAKLLSEFLNEYLDAMTDIVYKTGGTLDKYIGDAVMAFWGSPIESNAHAHSACVAAIEMQVWVTKNKDRIKKIYNVELQIGIGISTGVMSVGNMGSQKSLGYTVIGDTVNLASRLESATKDYKVGIICAMTTIESIQKNNHKLPRYEVIDKIQVKGKNNLVEVAQIIY